MKEFERWDIFNDNVIALRRASENIWCLYGDGYENNSDGTREDRLEFISCVYEDVFPTGVFPSCASIGKVFYRPSEVKPEPRKCVSYETGTIIRIDGCGDYILACVDGWHYSLIDLKYGNRWTEPKVESGNTRTFTENDINEMVGDDFTWEVVER